MPISNVIVTNSQKEKDFVSAFITSVMDNFPSNHSLVCKINNSDTIPTESITTSNVEEKVNTAFGGDSTPSGTLNIWFIIDTYTVINIQRNSFSTPQTDSYSFSTSFNGISGSSSTLKFYISGGTSPRYETATTRTYAYQIVSNENVLYIVFGGASQIINFPLTAETSYPLSSVFSYKKTVSNNTVFACGNTVESTLRSTDGQVLQAVDRLKYNNSTDSTAIETIQNKVIVTSTGKNKVITMDNIWDSTYNAVVMVKMNIDSSLCVYLNNYTLMLI